MYRFNRQILLLVGPTCTSLIRVITKLPNSEQSYKGKVILLLVGPTG
jgi:hypothetical protein